MNPCVGKVITEKKHVQIVHWHFDYACQYREIWWYIAGYVIGHPKIKNYRWMGHSSEIRNVKIDEQKKEVVVESSNNVIHGRLAECDYSREENYKYLPELRKYRPAYSDPRMMFPQENNTVLLVLSDRYPFYWRYAAQKDDAGVVILSAYGEEGKSEKRVLIVNDVLDLSETIFINYSVNLNTITVHKAVCPEDSRLFVENAGDDIIKMVFSNPEPDRKVIHLDPGVRLEITDQRQVVRIEGKGLANNDGALFK